VPAKRAEANQDEALEAAAASMGDHAMSDAVRGAKAAWPGGLCEGRVGA